MQSLSEECTPLKQRYDACFNLWFEGYLQPALDHAELKARAAMPDMSFSSSPTPPTTSASSSTTTPSDTSDSSTSTPLRRIITSWATSSAFRTRPLPPPPAETYVPADDMVGARHIHQDIPDAPLDTTGMTRAQIQAAEYERRCGRAWREYQTCLRKGISENQNLTSLLTQAREEHPLHSAEGLAGSPWDPEYKGGDN